MKPVPVQTFSLSQFDFKQEKEDPTNGVPKMYVELNNLEPLSLRHLVMLKFERNQFGAEGCLNILKSFKLEGDQKAICDSNFVNPEEDEKFIDNQFYKVQLSRQGLVKEVKNVMMGTTSRLDQQIWSYPGDGGSGIYLFGPDHAGEAFDDISLVQTRRYAGPLVKCIQAMIIGKTKLNVFVMNLVCLTKQGELSQVVEVKHSSSEELTLRQKKTHGYRFFSDDSFDLVNREMISEDKAMKLNVLRFFKKGHKDIFSPLGLHLFPCTDGYVIQENGSKNGVTAPESFLGVSFSHPAGCNLVDERYFEIFLARSLKKNDNKGVSQLRNIDLANVGLKMQINTGTPQHVEKFYRDYQWLKTNRIKSELLTFISSPSESFSAERVTNREALKGLVDTSKLGGF
jgi:hypothetical protein